MIGAMLIVLLIWAYFTMDLFSFLLLLGGAIVGVFCEACLFGMKKPPEEKVDVYMTPIGSLD